MHAELTDFQTGWYEIAIGLRAEELDSLISLLQQLREGAVSHVQAASDYEGQGGIGDISFYMYTGDEDNLVLLGPPIMPKR